MEGILMNPIVVMGYGAGFAILGCIAYFVLRKRVSAKTIIKIAVSLSAKAKIIGGVLLICLACFMALSSLAWCFSFGDEGITLKEAFGLLVGLLVATCSFGLALLGAWMAGIHWTSSGFALILLGMSFMGVNYYLFPEVLALADRLIYDSAYRDAFGYVAAIQFLPTAVLVLATFAGTGMMFLGGWLIYHFSQGVMTKRSSKMSQEEVR